MFGQGNIGIEPHTQILDPLGRRTTQDGRWKMNCTVMFTNKYWQNIAKGCVTYLVFISDGEKFQKFVFGMFSMTVG